MKKIVLALALVVLAAANSFAGSKIETTVGGGIALPMGDFGDMANLGFGFSGRSLYKVNPNVGLGVAVAYNMFSASDDMKAYWGIDDVKFTTIEILGVGKFVFGKGSAKPYILAGAGFASFGMSVMGFSASSTELMLQPGLGVEIGSASSKVAFCVEGKMSVILTEGSTSMYLPIGVGVKF
jgi:hypothetical protein